MKYEPENYWHMDCYKSLPDPQPLKFAWPEEHYNENRVEVLMKYMAEESQFVCCPNCGKIWSTDDPIFKEADRIHWHKVRKYNKERRLELASDPFYRSIFKSKTEMWKHLKKCSIS